MAESHSLAWERVVEWKLPYRPQRQLWWLCTHHAPLSSLGTGTWTSMSYPSPAVRPLVSETNTQSNAHGNRPTHRTAESCRSPKFPSLHLNSEPKPSPVHDEAAGEAVGIGRGMSCSGDGRARGGESGRTHGVYRTIVEVVASAERVREVRHGAADRLLQLLLGA